MASLNGQYAEVGLVTVDWAKRELIIDGVSPGSTLAVSDVLAELDRPEPDIKKWALVCWPDTDSGGPQVELYDSTELLDALDADAPDADDDADDEDDVGVEYEDYLGDDPYENYDFDDEPEVQP